MAGDSQVSNGSIFGFTTKVLRAPDGRIYATCGPSADGIKLRRWIEDGGDFPKVSDTAAALILNLDGTVDWIDEDGELIRLMLPAAIGSGCDLAIGAMEAGLSPEEAVEVAKRRDVHTGGEVTVLHLEKSHMQAVA